MSKVGAVSAGAGGARANVLVSANVVVTVVTGRAMGALGVA